MKTPKHSYIKSTIKFLAMLLILIITAFISCKNSDDLVNPSNSNQPPVIIDDDDKKVNPDELDFSNVEGCDGQIYNEPSTSPYVLPFKPGKSFKTGLTNCSSSYHASGKPDQYAYDFNMPEGTKFRASRSGTVSQVINDQPSEGGGSGNYVLIDHHDNTFAYYLHSPKNGISVKVGDEVVQGELLGVTGRSGLAGYPHLHFIVVKNPPAWPYSAIPVSFKNAIPLEVPLKSHKVYKAGPL